MWTARDWRKACLPALLAYYRHAARGSIRIAYAALWPLVSTLPAETLAATTDFWEPFLAAVRDGAASENMPSGDGAAPFVDALIELVAYMARIERYTAPACPWPPTLAHAHTGMSTTCAGRSAEAGHAWPRTPTSSWSTVLWIPPYVTRWRGAAVLPSR